jgi:aminoglycoside phosphotransferase (APT) family kinase protein
MDTPWDCDIQLTPELVTRLVRAQAARLDSIQYLNEGWDSWVYTARDPQGREWILRFPKRAEVVAQLEREIGLLPLLAPRLPLAVPRFGLLGQPGEGYPHRFVGYPRLPGQPALERLEDALDVASSGKTLGAFLAVLHAFPSEEACRLGVEVDDDEGLDEWATQGEASLLEFGALLDTRTRERAIDLLRHPPPPSTAPVLLHNDFFPEHLLVEHGQLTGVIDWGDVALGDPGADLAGLFTWGGEPLLAAGLATYRQGRALEDAAVARLTARARFFAVLHAADDLKYGVTSGREAYTRAASRTFRTLG